MPSREIKQPKKHGAELRGPKGERIIPPGLRKQIEHEAKRLGFKGIFRPESYKIGE
jgi:hypothetical protein